MPGQARLRCLTALLCLALLHGIAVQAGAAEREVAAWSGPGSLRAVAYVPGGGGERELSVPGFLAAGELIDEGGADAEPGAVPASDGMAVRVDMAGRILWMRVYGGDGSERFDAVAACADGGAFLAGASGSFGSAGPGENAWLVRIGPRGEDLWQAFPGEGVEGSVSGVLALDDGGCLVALRLVDDLGPSLCLVRYDARGRQTWSGPEGLLPVGVPGELRGYPSRSFGNGMAGEGGLALAGTAFVRQGGSQPYVLFLDSRARAHAVLDLRVPANAGSGTCILSLGPAVIAAWTGDAAGERIVPGAARLTSDGVSPLTFGDPQTPLGDEESAMPFGLARLGKAVVAGVNLPDRNAVRLVPLRGQGVGSDPGAGSGGLPEFPAREGLAVASDEKGTLAVVGETRTAGPVGQPWFALWSRSDFPAVAGPAEFQTVLVEPDDPAGRVTCRLALDDGGQAVGVLAEIPGKAWPQAMFQLRNDEGAVRLSVVLPQPSAEITTIAPLASVPGGWGLGLSVPATPGPTQVRLIAVDAQGSILLNQSCAQARGRVTAIEDSGQGSLKARGVLELPEGFEQLFLCTGEL